MTEPLRLRIDRIGTPIGELVLIADEADRLRVVDWSDREADWRRGLRRHYGADGFTLTAEKNPGGFSDVMRAYFAGDLAAIEKLPVATGGTDFQKTVWRALRRIPSGKTVSYAGLARRIGRETAVRAVGLANGANPISIVVPCHRVIGSDGSLTGYGGGIHRKRWLLAHEGLDTPSD
ncbi:MAG TPA: methylated-DNA--[protein]-cysteine S-methyltransferase [Stellaceae bacterium]|nr:methylated-DNA--[protein]-cysteine S-methyltransferase [Stellaceae bacterium]